VTQKDLLNQNSSLDLAFSQSDASDYIEDMLLELTLIAEKADLPDIANVLKLGTLALNRRE